MRLDNESGDADVVFEGANIHGQKHIDVYLDSPYHEAPDYRVRFSRTEFAVLLWHGWLTLIRSL